MGSFKLLSTGFDIVILSDWKEKGRSLAIFNLSILFLRYKNEERKTDTKRSFTYETAQVLRTVTTKAQYLELIICINSKFKTFWASLDFLIINTCSSQNSNYSRVAFFFALFNSGI